jgi:hypothetical protein
MYPFIPSNNPKKNQKTNQPETQLLEVRSDFLSNFKMKYHPSGTLLIKRNLVDTKIDYFDGENFCKSIFSFSTTLKPGTTK